MVRLSKRSLNNSDRFPFAKAAVPSVQRLMTLVDTLGSVVQQHLTTFRLVQKWKKVSETFQFVRIFVLLLTHRRHRHRIRWLVGCSSQVRRLQIESERYWLLGKDETLVGSQYFHNILTFYPFGWNYLQHRFENVHQRITVLALC